MVVLYKCRTIPDYRYNIERFISIIGIIISMMIKMNYIKKKKTFRLKNGKIIVIFPLIASIWITDENNENPIQIYCEEVNTK